MAKQLQWSQITSMTSSVTPMLLQKRRCRWYRRNLNWLAPNPREVANKLSWHLRKFPRPRNPPKVALNRNYNSKVSSPFRRKRLFLSKQSCIRNLNYSSGELTLGACRKLRLWSKGLESMERPPNHCMPYYHIDRFRRSNLKLLIGGWIETGIITWTFSATKLKNCLLSTTNLGLKKTSMNSSKLPRKLTSDQET